MMLFCIKVTQKQCLFHCEVDFQLCKRLQLLFSLCLRITAYPTEERITHEIKIAKADVISLSERAKTNLLQNAKNQEIVLVLSSYRNAACLHN